jgi:hypothetical protein
VLGHEVEKIGKFKIIFARYVGKPGGKRQRRRHGYRGNCNIKVGFKEIGFGERKE